MRGDPRRTLPWAAAIIATLGAGAALPQAEPDRPPPSAQSPGAPRPGFLFLNQERILTGSRAGQALLAEEEAARDKLRAEARAIDTAFEAEEGQLTELRSTLPAEEFRAKADEFDARVVEARREQDERSAVLAQEFDQRRRQFYARVAPVLVMLMERFGAQAIFDENSVLLADQAINITEAVIAEIDARAEQLTPEAGEADEGE